MSTSKFIDYSPARVVKGSSRWYVEFYQVDPITKVKERTREYHNLNRIKDKRERLRKAITIVNHLNNDLLPFGYPYIETSKLPEMITIEKGVTLSLAIKCRSDRAKTVSSYTSIVNHFVGYIAKTGRSDVPIKDFGLRDAVAYLDHVLITKKVSPRTYNNYRLFLNAIWSELIERGYINFSPWSKVKKQKVTEKNRRMISTSEAQTILNHVWQNDKMLTLSILLLYYCFIRPGEQRRMRVSCIDMRAGIITLPGAITKNKKTEQVTIPKAIIPFLEEIGIDRWHANDYIFGSNMQPHPEKMCGSNSLAERHKAVINHLVKIGTLRSKTGLSIYSWKDSGAMALIRAGIDVYEVMRQMRHSDLSTTQKYLKSLHNVNKSIQDNTNLILPKNVN